MSDKIHLHSLGHSCAWKLVQNGVSLYVVKEILGHQDISTTTQYSHLKKDNLSQALKVLDRVV